MSEDKLTAKENKQVQAITPLNEAEKALIARREAKEKELPPKILEFTVDDKNNADLFGGYKKYPRGTKEEKSLLVDAMFSEISGALDLRFGGTLLDQCINASIKRSDAEDGANVYAFEANAVLALLHELKPQDPFEGMLISHIISQHYQLMKHMAKANKCEHEENMDMHVNRVAKLTRLFNESLDALTRYRRKGEQKVSVTHNYVQAQDGSKVIVGDVNADIGLVKGPR